MVSRLNPYLSFTNNARQALDFYRQVFGGTVSVSTFGEFGVPDGLTADNVMHGLLEVDNGFALMCADTPPGMEYHPGNNISVSLSGDDVDELRGYWAKLAADGAVSVPLEQQMWGDEFGMCVDKFGITWMVNISGRQD